MFLLYLCVSLCILTVRLCMGGLTVLGAGTLPISFFRIVSKLRNFYMTLLGHLFPKHWFKFYVDILPNDFLAIFYHVCPLLYCSSCCGDVFQFHLAVQRQTAACVTYKWSPWEANDVCVVGEWDALQFCTFGLHTPGMSRCPPSQPPRLIAARIRLMTIDRTQLAIASEKR